MKWLTNTIGIFNASSLLELNIERLRHTKHIANTFFTIVLTISENDQCLLQKIKLNMMKSVTETIRLPESTYVKNFLDFWS